MLLLRFFLSVPFAVHFLLSNHLCLPQLMCVAKRHRKLKEESSRIRHQAEEKKKRKEELQHQKQKQTRSGPNHHHLHVSLHPSQILCLANKSLKARSVISSSDLYLSPYPLTIPNTEKVPWIQGTSVLSHLITMIYPRNSQRCPAST